MIVKPEEDSCKKSVNYQDEMNKGNQAETGLSTEKQVRVDTADEDGARSAGREEADRRKRRPMETGPVFPVDNTGKESKSRGTSCDVYAYKEGHRRGSQGTVAKVKVTDHEDQGGFTTQARRL